MSKKTNKKKKVNLKLESGQTFLVEDLQTLIHIQKTYASMLRGQIPQEDREVCNKIITAINIAVENVYIATDESNDEDYWN